MTSAAATVELASSITHQIQGGSMTIAMPIALAAGFLSFVSPCVLPLVPGYLSYVTGMSAADLGAEQAVLDRVGGGSVATAQLERPHGGGRLAVGAWPGGRVLAGSSLFVLGFALVFVSFGAAFGSLGSILRGHETTLSRVFGVITVLLGLSFAGAFRRFRIAGAEFRFHHAPTLGLIGAPVLGVMFGLGWTPCIGPTLSAVLGLAASTGAAANRGALLAFVYCLGLGIPFIVVGLAFRRSMAALSVIKRHYRVVLAVGGGLLVVTGLFEVTGMWSQLVEQLQTRFPATASLL